MKVGTLYPVWWTTGKRDTNGTPLASVLKVTPYRGKYPQLFNTVLLLQAPNTRAGAIEMAVQL